MFGNLIQLMWIVAPQKSNNQRLSSEYFYAKRIIRTFLQKGQISAGYNFSIDNFQRDFVDAGFLPVLLIIELFCRKHFYIVFILIQFLKNCQFFLLQSTVYFISSYEPVAGHFRVILITKLVLPIHILTCTFWFKNFAKFAF